MTPAVAADRDYTSIGQLAAHLQRSVRAIETASRELQLQPALRLNGVVHFSAPQVEMLLDHFSHKD
jgi:hypothetical protein